MNIEQYMDVDKFKIASIIFVSGILWVLWHRHKEGIAKKQGPLLGTPIGRAYSIFAVIGIVLCEITTANILCEPENSHGNLVGWLWPLHGVFGNYSVLALYVIVSIIFYFVTADRTISPALNGENMLESFSSKPIMTGITIVLMICSPFFLLHEGLYGTLSDHSISIPMVFAIFYTILAACGITLLWLVARYKQKETDFDPIPEYATSGEYQKAEAPPLHDGPALEDYNIIDGEVNRPAVGHKQQRKTLARNPSLSPAQKQIEDAQIIEVKRIK